MTCTSRDGGLPTPVFVLLLYVYSVYSAGQGHPSDVGSCRRSHRCGTSITESTRCGHQHKG